MSTKTANDHGYDFCQFQAECGLHALSDKLQGLQVVSLTHSYRTSLTLQITDHAVLLVDMGSHDAVFG